MQPASTPLLPAPRWLLISPAQEFGAASGGLHIVAGQGTSIKATGNYTISGGAYAHAGSYDGGLVLTQSVTVTVSGTPAFSYFGVASRGGTFLFNGNTYSGSATGARYLCDTAGGMYWRRHAAGQHSRHSHITGVLRMTRTHIHSRPPC